MEKVEHEGTTYEIDLPEAEVRRILEGLRDKRTIEVLRGEDAPPDPSTEARANPRTVTKPTGEVPVRAANKDITIYYPK